MVLSSSEVLAQSPPNVPPTWTQRDETEGGGRRGRFWDRWWRGSSENEKNTSNVKTLYAHAASSVAASTVRVLVDGKPVALGTVVDAGGFIVTKASLLDSQKKLSCRLEEGRDVDATLVGINENYDLGLLQVSGETLAVPSARKEAATPGTFVAAVDAEGEVISVGVVSVEPRAIQSAGRPNPRRAWLGISLGGGESRTGITSVSEGSAAQRAGLRKDDEIISIDAAAMKHDSQIVETIGRHSPGDTVSLLVRRGGEELTLSATLGRPPEGNDPQDQWGGGPFSERRDGFPEVIAHDTIVLPSQCGGPLVDTDGRVVGINIARALRVTTYAIAWDKVVRLAEELRKR